MKGGTVSIALAVGLACGALAAAAAGDGPGPLPAPRYGKTVNLQRVSGVVRVQPPGARSLERLRKPRRVPIGTLIDVTGGRVRLTSAATRNSTAAQSADFFYGEFRVTQTSHGSPVTVLRLVERLSCGPPRAAHASRAGALASRAHPHGLWGSGKGNFRTVGNHGAATVQGTIWWSRDRCDGTFFRVKRGVVAIRDFRLRRTVRIHAGQRYLAAAG
jgi:hypothetical protein